MNILKELAEKAEKGKLSEDEKMYFDFLLTDLKYREKKDLSDEERRILEKYDSSGPAAHTKKEIERRSERMRAEAMLRLQKEEVKTEGRKVSLRIFAMAAGCAAVLIAAALFLYLPTKAESVYYSGNTMKKLYLPDGTEALMNKGSELALAGDFDRRDRKVRMSGEIFFKVKHDASKPFRITHGELTTTVCGTSFTITDYLALRHNSVIVNTGRVQVSAGGKQLALLTPDRSLTYDRMTRSYRIEDTDAASYASWTTGRVVLRNADMDEFAFRIQQQYGKKIVVRDHAVGSEARINSVFDRETALPDLMENISLLYGLRYRIEGNTVYLYK